ncbi:hypothetical protein E0W78_11250 [Aeromicrobium sp. IC_218]|nr:LuxR C-terminal-related transcriptional regulator [Aeromicrobium sp. IC_218]TCI97621.1 hypothetical protein E0W78_11250 [Aeromicrobium sp. IC_218]
MLSETGPRHGVPPRFVPGDPFPRPRLSAYLAAGRPLSLVVAPAGTGKTAGTRAWAVRADESVRWASPADVLEGTPPCDVLVVDDAHDLDEEGRRRLATLAADPAEPRLVVLSRTSLPWLTGSLGLLAGVDALHLDGLRLDDHEAAVLVRSHQPDLDEDATTSLVVAADGWAGAASLLAREWWHVARYTGPGGRTVPSGLAQAAEGLVEQALTSYPPELALVLAGVAHEPRITPRAARVLSGDPDADRLLHDAAADGLLVSARRGADEGVWRLHPLVAEVVRWRVRPGGPQHTIGVAAQTRAVAYYRRAGDAAAAVRHATLSGDLPLQLDAAHEYLPEIMSTGRLELAAAALAGVPEDIRSGSRAVVALDALLLRAGGQHDAARRVGDQALEHADDGRWRPRRSRDADADLAVLDLWQARCGWRSVDGALHRASTLLGCRHETGEHDHDSAGIGPARWCALMLELSALHLAAGDVDAADIHLRGLAAYAASASLAALSASAMSLRAVVELAHETYQTAAATGAATLDRLTAAVPLPASGTAAARAHLVRGLAHVQALELDAADAALQAAEAAGADPFDPLIATYRSVLRATLTTIGGDVDEARRILDAAADAPGPVPGFARRHLALSRMATHARAGDLSSMLAKADVLDRLGHPVDATLVRAFVRGLSGDPDGAVHDIDALLDSGRVGGWTSPDSVSRVTAAGATVGRVAFLLRAARPDTDARAADLLPDVLTRTAPHRLWWVLAGATVATDRLPQLLARELERPDAHPAARTALEAVLSRPTEPRPLRPAPVTPPPADDGRTVLTARELDVLHALAQGGTNHAIASALFLSENTVKTHLASIYRKLEVDRRAKALAVARVRGLL